MADLRSKIRGFIGSIFQFGLGGAQLKPQGSDTLEVRNSTDAAYGVMRVATPLADNDAVTKLYADSLSKPLIVGAQVDTSSSIPNNTAVRRFLVVTTAGSGAVIGDVLYDNGLNDSNPMVILGGGPIAGRTLAITVSLTGGTVEFDADSIYIWDADGMSWLKIGDIGGIAGAVRTIRVPFTFSDQGSFVDSTATIPANARITRTVVEITTVFDGTTPTVTVGRDGSTALLQGTTDNLTTALGQYTDDEITAWGGSELAVRVTVGGTGASQGVGAAYVMFTLPTT